MNKSWNLIQKFLMNRISDAERAALEDWLNQDVRHRQKFEQAKKIWELSGNSDEPVYNLEEEKQKIIQNIRNLQKPVKIHRISKLREILPFFRVASVILLIVTTAFFAWMYGSRSSLSNFDGTILVSHVSGSKINLPDSSSIHLNKESKVIFRQNSRQRTVKLDGEAFFKVQHDVKRPFIIYAGHATVRVLGTSFLVRSYPGQPVLVSVISGKVTVSHKDKHLEIETGEEIMISTDEEIQKIDRINPNELAWKTGKLTFEHVQVREVLKELEKMYDVKFDVEHTELLSCPFTGKFDQLDLKETLEILAFSLHISVEYMDNKRILLLGYDCL
ncbi:MAG: FecR domain-containing protein [Cytophagales bacterium]|nr:FecR domain-containing protein [Cytophagales bacterium]